MPYSRVLPRTYYECAVIGKMHLSQLSMGPADIAAGFSRSGFLFAQMEAAATLELSARASLLNGSRSVKKWRHTFSQVPGFCWTKLMAAEWLVPPSAP